MSTCESIPTHATPTTLIRRLLAPALIVSALAAGGASAETAAPAAPAAGLDPALVEQVQSAADGGLAYLRGTQAENGSWSDSVGVTALALRGFLENPGGPGAADADMIAKAVEFLLDHVNDDGSISETNHNRNYNTAVAIPALAATGDPKHAEVIANAQAFLKGLQLDESDGYESDHAYYGGIGYGADERPDLSNIYMSIEALHATELDQADPVWDKALTFVARCQNNSETNDQAWAADDGGFTYMPGKSQHAGSKSYGGMTSAGLLSLLFAGADKDDPRVQAAYDWIRANYTVEQNPGAKEGQGRFYYYNAFSKAMRAYGEPTVTDTVGTSHNWRDDLARQLIALKQADGSWVNELSPRWWEGDPNLCTAWTLIALNQILAKD